MIQNTQMQIQALNESMARDRDRRLMLERADRRRDSVGGRHAAAGPVAERGDADRSRKRHAGQQLERRRRQALRQLELRLKPEHPDVHPA